MSETPRNADPAALAQMEEAYAVIYTPRRTRKRFAENTVFIKASDLEAIEAEDEANHLYPAKVCGPFRSSEGMRLYYLVEWL